MINSIVPSKDTGLLEYPGILAYKTLDHEVIACNQTYLDYSGIKSLDQLYGLTDHNLPWQQFTEIYHKQEQDALNNNVYNAIQPGRDSSGREFVIFNSKLPRLDEQNNVIGIVSLTIEVINPSMFEICDLLKKTALKKDTQAYFIGNIPENPKLTPRELECLFYMIRGKTAKKIAQLLKISHRTVEMYMEKLKTKFNCGTKSELIEIAINNGYMKIIPPSCYGEKLLGNLKF